MSTDVSEGVVPISKGGARPEAAVTQAPLTRRTRLQLAILAAAGVEVRPDTRILDLGCGEGNSVRALRDAGFDVSGCDIALWDSPVARELEAAGHIRKIEMQPYRLPFDDGRFDIVMSSEVLEHVMNYREFIAENRRVQSAGGVSMHIFPGRWTPIEMHVKVPLASVHRSYPWLLFWATLGIRNEFQKGRRAREVARLNFEYLRDHTNYPTTAFIRHLFEQRFSRVEFHEELFLRSSQRPRAKAVNAVIQTMPFLLGAYRTCWNRVLFAWP